MQRSPLQRLEIKKAQVEFRDLTFGSIGKYGGPKDKAEAEKMCAEYFADLEASYSQPREDLSTVLSKQAEYATEPHKRIIDKALKRDQDLRAAFQKDPDGSWDGIKKTLQAEAAAVVPRLNVTEFYMLQFLVYGNEEDRYVAAKNIISLQAHDRIMTHNAVIMSYLDVVATHGKYIEKMTMPLMPSLPEFTTMNNISLAKCHALTPLTGNGVSTVFDAPSSGFLDKINVMLSDPILEQFRSDLVGGSNAMMPVVQDASGAYMVNMAPVEAAFNTLSARFDALSKHLRGNALSTLVHTRPDNQRGRGGRNRGRGGYNHQAQTQTNQSAHTQYQHPQQNPPQAPAAPGF